MALLAHLRDLKSMGIEWATFAMFASLLLLLLTGMPLAFVTPLVALIFALGWFGPMAVPLMLRLGYDRKLAIGVCCAGGALGTMIPPSIVLIVYGLTANVSIGDLFTASFVPGLMLAGLYVLYIYVLYILVRVYLNPAMAPIPELGEIPPSEKLGLMKGLFLPGLVVFFVLGSILGGIASVTEASAVGVFGVTLSTMVRGEFSMNLLIGAGRQTLSTVGMIVWIGIGATALVGVFNLMGGINFVSQLITGISEEPIVIILFMMAILFVLGMFLEWVGIALLTMPIFAPIVVSLGYDPVWFGVVFAMNMQVSFLSPPFGPAAFYLKSVAPPDISLGEIFQSLLPFIGLQIIALGLLLAFPGITLIEGL